MGLFDIFKKKSTPAESEPAKTESELSVQTEAAKRALNAVKAVTDTPCVRLTLSDEKPDLFASKVGGIGYVAHNEQIPEDKNGRQLRLLAQIDCAQVKLDEFPKRGLLQFWILNDTVYGMSFDDNTCQDTFRIVYHEEVDGSVTEQEVKAKVRKNEFDDDGMMPVQGEFGIRFEMGRDQMSEFDVRFEKLFCDKYNDEEPSDKIGAFNDLPFDPADEIPEYESLAENASGHKIGGYPAFTQYDPRSEDTDHDFLLLQLDSDYGSEGEKIMWGDAGICGFFINREKLKKLDFSDVIYNWDCY